jgi:ribosome biogenesis GTPase
MTGAATGRGIVLQGTGGVWQVRTDSGETRPASLRGRLKKETGDAIKLAVGDDVVLERDERDSGWVITEILERRSKLARRAPGGARGERVIAANIDQVVVVFAAANPEPHPRMLDRFLVIAEGNDLKARVIINKIDLVDVDETRERFGDYTRAGYPVHLTSVKRGDGLEEVRETLSDRVSVLSGPSGVGKSSLMNTLFPGLNLRVGEISESVNKGRHTTVGAMLHPLPGGGAVVDTPGLREVGMWGLDPDALDVCFPELRPYLNQCRFRDCTHAVEPGCAVRAALEAGEVSRARWESYLKLRAELAGESPG